MGEDKDSSVLIKSEYVLYCFSCVVYYRLKAFGKNGVNKTHGKIWNSTVFPLIWCPAVVLRVTGLPVINSPLMSRRCLESHWFTWVTQCNHLPMEIDDDKEKPWLTLQMSATCDLEKSLFNDWFTGHLNFQIEHQ